MGCEGQSISFGGEGKGWGEIVANKALGVSFTYNKKILNNSREGSHGPPYFDCGSIPNFVPR